MGKHAAKVGLMLCCETEFGSKITTVGAEIPFSLNSPRTSSFASLFSHPHFSSVAEWAALFYSAAIPRCCRFSGVRKDRPLRKDFTCKLYLNISLSSGGLSGPGSTCAT